MFKKLILKIIIFLGYNVTKIRNEKKDPLYNLHYLKEIPRYTEITIKLFNRDFKITDSLSFYNSYFEIFIDKIYNFKTKNNNPFIIDCGTNVGTSILFFKSIYPKSQIIGFEADPYIFNICENNINSFEFDDVSLINCALWDTVDEIEFMSEGADGGRANSLESDIKKIKVKTGLLSNYINQKVDFLKIDIEGAESKVIHEISNKLHLVDLLFIEYHSFIDSHQNLSSILKIVEQSGFRYIINTQMASKNPFTNKLVNLGMDNQLNIFCFK